MSEISRNNSLIVLKWNDWSDETALITGFGAVNSGECVADVCWVINGQSSSQYNNNWRSDFDGESPKIHQSQQVNQGECNAGEHPENCHQIGDQNQSDADDRPHR